MANAVGTKTIGLFEPTEPNRYRPWGKKYTIVSSQKTQQELAAIEKKIGPDADCLMTNLDVEIVLAAVCS